MFDARRLGHGDRREALILGLFAFLTALGWVLKLLVAEKDLFADGPNEILATVDAKNVLVFEFGCFRGGGAVYTR